MDAADINATYDLLSVIEADISLKKSGGWWIGPCPFCGGQDRFNLHKTPSGWRWFCRGCGEGKYHGAVDYLMKRDGASLAETLEKLTTGSVEKRKRFELPKEKAESQYLDMVRLQQPGDAWQARGKAFVESCRANLWLPVGKKALDYLTLRGFNMPTLAKYSIGYNPEDRFEPLSEWGLDGDGQVWLARGITIPCFGPGGLWYIKTRRPIAPDSKDKKYVKIRGSKGGVFGYDNLRGAWLAVITEGELDCMTLDQVAGDLAAVGTFGSATDSPLNVSSQLLRWHAETQHTLVCFDNDEQGQEGARRFQELLPKCKIINLPDCYHDINDAHLAGFDLGNWICREVERLGIVEPEKDDTWKEIGF